MSRESGVTVSAPLSPPVNGREMTAFFLSQYKCKCGAFAQVKRSRVTVVHKTWCERHALQKLIRDAR